MFMVHAGKMQPHMHDNDSLQGMESMLGLLLL